MLWVSWQEDGNQPVWQQLQVWLDATVDTDDEDRLEEEEEEESDYLFESGEDE
jgi:hypothetical protein